MCRSVDLVWSQMIFKRAQEAGSAAEPANTYARHICQRLLIDLSWNSSRLEGNTYSLLETEQLFQAGYSADAQLSNEAVMILNDIRLLREVFIQSYERSAQRYTVIRGAVGEPDPFRVTYRQALAGIHEGNFARFRVRPSEFEAWKAAWR